MLLELEHVNNACARIIYIPNTRSWYLLVNRDAQCNISRFFSQQINTPSHQQICIINLYKCKRTDIFLWVSQQSDLCYRLLSVEEWLRDPQFAIWHQVQLLFQLTSAPFAPISQCKFHCCRRIDIPPTKGTVHHWDTKIQITYLPSRSTSFQEDGASTPRGAATASNSKTSSCGNHGTGKMQLLSRIFSCSPIRAALAKPPGRTWAGMEEERTGEQLRISTFSGSNQTFLNQGHVKTDVTAEP